MSDGSATPDDDDLTAAEYVLGTLDASERRTFAQRLGTDAAARRAVADWDMRFAGLADRLDQVAPSAAVWQGIERAVNRDGAVARPALTVIQGGAKPVRDAGLVQSRGRWRAAALSLGAIAAALAAFVIVDLTQPKPGLGEHYVAAVNRGGDRPALIVSVDLRTRQVVVVPVAAEAPAGRSLELWYIGDDKPPRPMGLVDKSTATMPIPAGAEGAGATFAVSVEPTGGSTTGAPTGPVVYSGKLVKE